MSLLKEKASNLSQAIKNLDHTHALDVTELSEYFISRNKRIIERMGKSLDYDYPQKYLFTGHRGTGKSTELAKFQERFDEDFFIIRYSVDENLDLYDITYVDVLLSIALEIVAAAEEQDIKLNKKTTEALENFGKEIISEKESKDSEGFDVGVGTGALLSNWLKVKARLSTESETRKLIRDTVEHKISELISIIDAMAQDVKEHSQKELVCIVEDLDKADIAVSQDIFYGHGKTLSEPNIAIIYTFPVALQNNQNFTQIRQFFSDKITLPNFRVSERDGGIGAGFEKLRTLIYQRIEEALIDDNALEKIIAFSGGVPRILLQLARNAALEADLDDEKVIRLAHVTAAIRRDQRDFQRLLNAEQLQLLQRIHISKNCQQSKEEQALLHNLSVLEYLDDDAKLWYDVNPLVVDLLPENTED